MPQLKIELTLKNLAFHHLTDIYLFSFRSCVFSSCVYAFPSSASSSVCNIHLQDKKRCKYSPVAIKTQNICIKLIQADYVSTNFEVEENSI